MKYQYPNFVKKMLFFSILLFLGMMTVSVTHAETYTFVTKWGSTGEGIGQIFDVQGIAFDSSGNVIIADNGNARIEKFDNNGNYLTQWGSPGSEKGQFGSINDIAVDK
jgi:tripartite motif-containing protein 71